MSNLISNPLEGVTTRGFHKTPKFRSSLENPQSHSPFGMQNRVLLEKWSPSEDGPVMTQQVVQEGNIMCSIGIDYLVNRLATGIGAFTATNTDGWVQSAAVGTGVTGPASTDTALANSTSSVHISDGAGSMQITDPGGNRTLEYRMTISDANAYTLAEVGLFASSVATNNCVARSTLVGSDQVVKGTSDTVNISHQIEFTTLP